MKCQKCGAENPDGVAFCGFCFEPLTPVAAGAAPPPGVAPSQTQPPAPLQPPAPGFFKNPEFRWLWIFIVLAGAGYGARLYTASKPSTVIAAAAPAAGAPAPVPERAAMDLEQQPQEALAEGDPAAMRPPAGTSGEEPQSPVQPGANPQGAGQPAPYSLKGRMLRAEQLHLEKEAAFNRLLAEMEKNLTPGENSDPDRKYLRRYSEIVSQSAQKFTALKLPCAGTMPEDEAYAEWFRQYEKKEDRLSRASLGRLTKFMKLDISR